jgi:hypothetical protein
MVACVVASRYSECDPLTDYAGADHHLNTAETKHEIISDALEHDAGVYVDEAAHENAKASHKCETAIRN